VLGKLRKSPVGGIVTEGEPIKVPQIPYVHTKFFENDKYYDLFVDARTGEYINGREVHPFSLWIPDTPEQPRWLRIRYRKFRTGYRGTIRCIAPDMKTYLDSEIHPVIKMAKLWDEVEVNGRRFYAWHRNKGVHL